MDNSPIAAPSHDNPMSASGPTSSPEAGLKTGPLRPALFARYGDLDNLRYDYPLVLIEDETGAEGDLVRPLSRIVDEALRTASTTGTGGEAMRQQALKLEMRLRQAVSAGRDGRLSSLWREFETELVRESGEEPFGPMDRNLDAVWNKIKVDGRLIGCDASAPNRILGHVWKVMHVQRARAFRNKVDGLILKLTDILKSDHMKSDEAHGASALSAAMGIDGDGSIDFSALSHVLDKARPEDRLPKERVKRIEHVLHVLQCQPFFGPARTSFDEPEKAVCYSYVFRKCSDALEAYRERLPGLVEFVKAITIAELEVENKYSPDLHDEIFARFDESDLTEEQMDYLPPAMIYLRDGVTDSAELARTYEALACGLPIKVLIQVDDLLGPTSPEPPVNSFGAGTSRLASMAMGLNNAFVLQSTSAHLYRIRGGLISGMQYGGPALFAVYSGASETVEDIPPYLLAAAANECRAFPTFAFDPSAGSTIATRFDLSGNLQAESDWPGHELNYEDKAGQWKSEEVAFTFGDFAMCDSRYRRFCHAIRQPDWSTDMVPFADWLMIAESSDDIRVPYVLGTDDAGNLMRVALDEKITVGARRCVDGWRRLQEMAGINNSHVIAVLAEERKKREAMARELAEAEANAAAAASAAPAVPAPTQTPSSNASTAPVVDVEEPEAIEEDDGAPWIETPRCTTCNECTQISSSLFAYNDNMQAYVVDPDGGTYRQLVEAAESCQVSIIHPGQPRNSQEPDLADLVERAKPFN